MIQEFILVKRDPIELNEETRTYRKSAKAKEYFKPLE